MFFFSLKSKRNPAFSYTVTSQESVFLENANINKWNLVAQKGRGEKLSHMRCFSSQFQLL